MVGGGSPGFQASCKSPFGSVVEHPLGKGEVAGPIPAKGTSFKGFDVVVKVQGLVRVMADSPELI